MATDIQLNSWRDQIEFVYQPLDELERIGEITFFRDGRFPGFVAFGNELFHFQDAFECHFAEGFVARSPGLVGQQELRILYRGKPTTLIYEHGREVACVWFGYRPIIEVTTPDDQKWHFSYRRVVGGDMWCRLIPCSQPVPYCCLDRQIARVVWLLIDLPYVLLMTGLAAGGITAIAAIVVSAVTYLLGRFA